MKKVVLIGIMLVGCLYADLLDLKYEKICDDSKKDCQMPIPNQLKWNIKTLSFDSVSDSSDKQDDNKNTTHKEEQKMKKLVLLGVVIVSGFALMQDCGWKMRELEKAVDEFKKCENSADKDKNCEVLMQKIQTLADKHHDCINEQYYNLQIKMRQ